jgi:hypothetical protein
MTTTKKLIKHYVTTMTQSCAQTEAHIFSHFEKRASVGLINEALDELMDEGVVRATVIDAQTMGFGFLPGLCRAAVG